MKKTINMTSGFYKSIIFAKLYNYLKIHNVSSSFNARNRIFLERSAKIKRLVAAFGATFRNSK
jgi:hypothetical protein